MDFNKKGNKAFFNDKLLFRALGVAFLIIIFALVLADFKIYQKKRVKRTELTVNYLLVSAPALVYDTIKASG